MFKKLYKFLLSTKYFNPYELISEDHGFKLVGSVDSEYYSVIISKSEQWCVLLLKGDRCQYDSHFSFKKRPNKFQILRAANKLINQNRKK